MRRCTPLAALAIALLAHPSLARAAGAPVRVDLNGNPVMLVVDISGSMGEDDGTGRIKIEGAKSALLTFLARVEPGTPIGLRTYPDQSGDSCNNGSSRFTIAPRNPAVMSALVRTLQANGDTPTAEALRAAAAEIRATGAEQGTLVLLSDGESTCANPCEAARAIEQSGISIRAITIGFRISPQGRKELKCIADATGGAYIDIDDGSGLAGAFDLISRPSLSIALDYPAQVVAEVGSDPSNRVPIAATITNKSERLARNVVARLRFDSKAPGVSQPVLALGNLAAGEGRTVQWSFRASVSLAGSTVRFTVLARAANGLSDAQARGSIAVQDQNSALFAGPLLRDRKKLAILGDSYSSGEGAGAYLPGTDTDANACHKSSLTYLMAAFRQPPSSIVACSGAITQDIFFPREAPAQLDQLSDLVKSRGTDAVALTLGGNDAGFGTIAKSCIVMPVDCRKQIFPSLPYPGTWIASDTFVEQHLDGLGTALETAYLGINSVVNSESALANRGSAAPILVLAYAFPIPRVSRPCDPMLDKIAPDETEFLVRFAAQVNGVIEAAAQAARRRGAPVFFIPTSEDAFQPDHTVCDRDPYARSLASLDLGPLVGFLQASLAGLPQLLADVEEVKQFQRALKELVHPNRQGYRAVTRAVIRWSQSVEADADATFLRTAQPSQLSPPPQVVISNDDLGQLTPGGTPVLQGGTSYPLTEDGFAPNSPVEIMIHSEPRVLAQVSATASGRISTRVAVPPEIDSGRHLIEVRGVDRDGRPRLIRIPVKAQGRRWPLQIRVLALASAAVGVLALAAWLSTAAGVWRQNRRTKHATLSG
jgi:Ca-activated chloride channel homolog